MAQINHNISAPNDGLGDELRTAFDNQNAMNTELYEAKVDKVNGKGLSANDYTNVDKAKVDAIVVGAEVNIQSDWVQEDDTKKDYIKNKPTNLDFSGFEVKTNKQDSLTADGTGSKYPTVDAVKGSFYEYNNKNINSFNLVPLGVDSAAGQVINTTGGISTIGGNYKYKSFTNLVEPNTTYTLDKGVITQGLRLSFRDISNNILDYYSTPTEVVSANGKQFQIHEKSPLVFTTPANCVTVLINTVGADGVDPTANLTLTKGTYPFDFYKINSQYVGKKFHWLGDSMTEMGILQAKIQDNLRVINFLNGIGGALITPTFENIVGDGNRRPSFVERAKNNTLFPSDLNILFGGYNDYGYNAPIGDITDMIAPTFDGSGQINPSSVVGATYYSAINYILKYWSETFPNTPIKLITATYNGTGLASTYSAQQAYANAMIAAANKYNIPVLDLFHGSGINPQNVTALTSDGIHLNNAGAELVAPKISEFLNSSIGNNTPVWGDHKNLYPTNDGTGATGIWNILVANGITGAGAINKIPKFTAGDNLGNSRISDDGLEIVLGGTVRVPEFVGMQFGVNSSGSFAQFYYDSTAKELILTNGTGQNIFKIAETHKATFLGKVQGAEGVNSNEFITKGQLDASSLRPYKVYTALLTQSGTSAPVATVLENTLGGTVVFTRSSTGIYIGTLTGAFVANKTLTLGVASTHPSFLSMNRVTNDTFSIATENSGGNLTDGLLNDTSIEVRVYN
jgi:lysophospholipase L1-like esterase